jgi:hypothetical protein
MTIATVPPLEVVGLCKYHQAIFYIIVRMGDVFPGHYNLLKLRSLHMVNKYI